MAERISINDLSEKIDLALLREGAKIKTNQELLRRLSISKDYFSRIRSGLRVLTEEKFVELCAVCGIERKVWFLPLFEFGLGLGFSRKQISLITHTPLPGIDFSSRIKDRLMIENIFSQIEGLWESYYYSVSKHDVVAVRKDILSIDRVNEDGFMECRIFEEDLFYKGVCFPMQNQLMFMLEKELIYNEIITYCTNLPERFPPKLYGVLLCLSGGVQGVGVHTYPAAAKVAFRYIGNKAFLEPRYPGCDMKAIEDILRKEFCGYLDPVTVEDTEVKQILENISNIIEKNDIPSAITTHGVK
jgi:transcriptional regulator with XRE-family HTH domain